MTTSKLIYVVIFILLLSSPFFALAKNCKHGQPCGNSCISWDKTCHLGSYSLDNSSETSSSRAEAQNNQNPQTLFENTNELDSKPDFTNSTDDARSLINAPPQLNGIIHVDEQYSSEVKIKFPKGSTGTSWLGIVKDGQKNFILNLGKSQKLKVSGGDIYSWSLTSPTGKDLGCNDGSYCVSGDSIILPESGNYLISTAYRTTSCATCPYEKFRKVTLFFEAR